MEIFISYAREDESEAKRLHNSLTSKGFSPWLDKWSLLPGQIWRIEIEKAIRRSHFAVLLLSDCSVDKRGYFQKEIQLALDVFETLPAGQIFLIPARLNECRMPETLRAIQWVDMFPDWDEGLDLICKSIFYQRTKDIGSRSIEQEAPAPNDIKVIQPASELDPWLRAFSGYWSGRWAEVLPSQLIVEQIKSDVAIVVYTWGDDPSGHFERGYSRDEATVVSSRKIAFGTEPVTFEFEVDEHKDILHGVRRTSQSITKITMIRGNPNTR
jgi:hypothetical protein